MNYEDNFETGVRGGRPKKHRDGYSLLKAIRFAREEVNMVEELMEDTGCSYSDIVRMAVKNFYYMKKNPDFFR